MSTIEGHPRTMRRREFLGVGAAAGASAVLPLPLAAEPSRSAAHPAARATTAERERERDNVTWALPADHLNTLWTLLWPRLAARVWRGALPWPEVSPAQPVDITDWVRTQATWFANATVPVTNADGTVVSEPIGSDTFRAAVAELAAYLGRTDHAPIHFLGEGGYDFYLSETEVELWAPPRPGKMMEPRRELMSCYEFRRTGRPVLAIGGVMDTLAFLPEGPTGPGQIEVLDDETLTALCVPKSGALTLCGAVAGVTRTIDDIQNAMRADPTLSLPELHREVFNLLTELLPPDATDEQLATMRELSATVEDAAFFDRAKDALIALSSRPSSARVEQIEMQVRSGRMRVDDARPLIIRVLESLVEGDPSERERRESIVRPAVQRLVRASPLHFGIVREALARIGHELACKSVRADLYEAVLSSSRCWMVSGSVYRGILEQFPRFVAEVWGDGLDASPDGPTDVLTLADTVDGRTRVRADIERRMETALPEGMRFEFGNPARFVAGSGTKSAPSITTGASNLWDPGQLMITNSGFYFPWTVGAGGRVTGYEGLLDAIIEGRAGNPVFTDSSRSQ